MHCINCNAELIAGKQFCHVCGTRAGETCAQCNSIVEAGFRFCPECGAPIAGAASTAAAAQPEDRLARWSRHLPEQLAEKIRATQGLVAGERKLVTVMFCDLVGSTAIAERLDPEEYRDLLDGYLEIVFREVYAVEGVVNQLAGDGVMALFGAPIAHEDAPYRAVYAALAIRDALHTKEQHGGDPSLTLQARIGIHTGPVVVGGVGNDLKMDYTAIGDTTNLASRLQTAAEPRMVLISEATQRLIRGFFRLKPGRRLEVKGKTDPVTAFEVTGLSDTTTPMAIAEARGLTPLVGRANEFAQLDACWERVRANATQIVAIGGEAGSGKSRLLYEFRQRLSDEAVVLEARCGAMTQNVPHTPWISMLRDYFEVAPGADPVEACGRIQQKLAALGADGTDLEQVICRMLSIPSRHSGADAVADLPEDEIKRLTFERIGELLFRIAGSAPLVMIIEDLHWMDASSREMLDLAASTMCGHAELMIVTHRPEHQPFWRTRAAFTQINLLPLSDAETTEIIRSIAGGQLPEALEDGILAKAEGNPFFAEEITRALVEEGYLLRSDGQIRVTRHPSEMRLPGTVEEVIGARLDRLDPPAKRTVQVASVLGRQFHRTQLEAALADEEIDVAAALALLEDRGIIHRKTVLAGDEYRFGESLTQDIAYESLLLRQRRELHSRIGTLLEALPGDSIAERSALIAHHYSRSDDRAKALEALLRAGDDAESVPAFPTAAGFYRKAWTRAREMIASDDSESAAKRALRAVIGLVRMIVLYGWSDAEYELADLCSEGRALAERLGDEDALRHILVYWGMGLTSAGREHYDEGVALIREAHEMARRAADPLAAIRSARALAWGEMFDGQLDQARDQLAESLAELERLGFPTGSDVYLSSRYIRDRIQLHRDDLVGAEPARETLAQAEAHGNRTVQAGSLTTLALVAFHRGEYGEARELAERAIAIAESTGGMAQIRAVIAVAILARRELGEAQVPKHLELYAQGSVVGAEPLFAPLIVEACLALDEPARGKRFALSALETSGGRLRELAVLIGLGNALRALGPAHCSKVRDIYDRAWKLADALQARSYLAATALGRGELALAEGNARGARPLLEDARARYTTLGFTRYAQQAATLLAALPSDAQETA